MPACTYLSDNTIQYYRETLNDPELQEVLDEANTFDNGDWVIGRSTWETGRLWWKKTHVFYSLYVRTIHSEHQDINFAPCGNPLTNHGAVYNYLMGYVAGRMAAKYRGK